MLFFSRPSFFQGHQPAVKGNGHAPAARRRCRVFVVLLFTATFTTSPLHHKTINTVDVPAWRLRRASRAGGEGYWGVVGRRKNVGNSCRRVVFPRTYTLQAKWPNNSGRVDCRNKCTRVDFPEMHQQNSDIAEKKRKTGSGGRGVIG